MNKGVAIIHRGHKIVPVHGGWSIAGYPQTVFTTPEAAKQHIQMLEHPAPQKVVYVQGRPYELSAGYCSIDPT